MPSPNAQYGYKYFINKGYTPVQAAGIVGNLVQESSVQAGNGTRGGDGGMSHGVAQWNRERLDNLKGFAQSRGSSPWDLNTQFDFVDHELRGSGGFGGGSEKRAYGLMQNASNVQDATKAMISFERPQGFTWANPTAGHGWDNRLANAAKLAGVDPSTIQAQAPASQVSPQQVSVNGLMVDPAKIQGPAMPGTTMGTEVMGPAMPDASVAAAGNAGGLLGTLNKAADNKDITGGLESLMKGLGGGGDNKQKQDDTTIQPIQVAPMVDNSGARMQAGAQLMASLMPMQRRRTMGLMG